ncbi:MAG: N-acetyl-gamma-glutamyl-phosphate reductase [Evtepia sp.]
MQIIFIDGREGTTGLQIYERLEKREDISLLTIDEKNRKNAAARQECFHAADLVFLCLPDAAAREAVTMLGDTRVIDASTAHRTQDDWVYGLPELSGKRRAIPEAQRVANPGCHATGFLTAVTPLVELGIVPIEYAITCFSLTGYSGGGKKMIADYENDEKKNQLKSPSLYARTLSHKHLPEMRKFSGLTIDPVFCPIVDNYYPGMETTGAVHNARLHHKPTALQSRDALAGYYENETLITVAEFGNQEDMLSADSMAGTDSLRLIVSGNEHQTIVTALFDNLGKGASGAAVQNMNLMLGFPETSGLIL